MTSALDIVIPTYRRVNNQRTYEALPAAYRRRVTFVVRPDELEPMLERYGNTASVLVLPEHITTLPATRQWIWERFETERFVMCDDDIQSFRRRSIDWTGDRRMTSTELVTESDFDEMFACLERELDRPEVGMVAPSPSYQPVNLRYWPTQGSSDCVQFVMFAGPRLRGRSLRWDRLECQEDWDFLLQVLSQGLDTVRLTDYSFHVAPMGAEPGGLQAGGTTKEERLNAEAKHLGTLAALWPGYVVPSKWKDGRWVVKRAQLLKDARRPPPVPKEPGKRGRPKGSTKDPALKKSEKLTLELSNDELRSFMIAAANSQPRPLDAVEWARNTLLDLVKEST